MKKKIFGFVFLWSSLFLFCKPHFLFSQPRDIDEERLSLTKTGIHEVEELFPPQSLNLHADKEIKYVAGKDGKMFTPDDEIFHYFLAEYNEKGKMIKRQCFKTGPDKIPFTPDDELQNYVVFEYDAQGGPVKEMFYKISDGKEIQEYYSFYEHDAAGKKIKSIRYNPGGEVIRYIAYTYDRRGRVVKDVEYMEKGADDKWFTKLDTIERYHIREYDKSGRLIRTKEYHVDHQGRGSDGKWFTPDDVVSSTREFIYNKDGQLVKTLKAIGPGPDNKWFDNDDVMQYYTLHYYTLEKN